MDIIINNPFRILGLPVTATDRQITKRVDDLSMFCEMGKIKQYDTDFTFISPIERTPELIQRAASQIELPEQKLLHSLFWFWPGNSIDELVFELLKEGNPEKAKELWEKQVKDSILSNKNFPNYRNLALLNMTLSVKPGDVNLSLFLDAVRLHVKIFNHDSSHDFLKMTGGVTSNISIEDIQRHFADETHKVISTLNGQEDHRDAASRYFVAFNGASDKTIQYIRNKFTNDPVRQLESEIEKCQKIKQQDTSKTYTAANALYVNAKQILKNLEAILTKQDMHYQSIADKVAKELLICSTEHFNALIESDKSSNPINQSQKITLFAKELAAGPSTKAKVEEDLRQIENIKKQITDDVSEEKILKIFKSIVELSENLPDSDTLNKSDLSQISQKLGQFVRRSKAALQEIKAIGGANHQGYLLLSELVVGRVLNVSITLANKFKTYDASLTMLSAVEDMTMSAKLSNHFDTNWNVLKQNLSTPKNSGGCYIATLVYGSYEANEVLILRQFRDDVLSKYMSGRIFIRMYYAVSPRMVKLLKGHMKVQKIIRLLLNKLVRKIV